MKQQGSTTTDEPSIESAGPRLYQRERFTVADPAEVERITRSIRGAWFAPVSEEEVAAAWRQNAADFERLRREFADLQERCWRKRRGTRKSPAPQDPLPTKN
jgi:predicted aminopeptidase